MRTIVLLFASATLAMAVEPVTYHVSKGGKDKEKLMRVFEAVVDQEAKSNKVVGTSFKIVSRIDDQNFVVWIMRGNSEDFSTTYWLETEEKWNGTDGEVIPDIMFEKTEEIRKRGKLSLRVLKGRKPTGKEPLTKDSFIFRLKAGETWTLPRFEKVSCFRCNGKGNLGALAKNAKCSDCNGSGGEMASMIVSW